MNSDFFIDILANISDQCDFDANNYFSVISYTRETLFDQQINVISEKENWEIFGKLRVSLEREISSSP